MNVQQVCRACAQRYDTGGPLPQPTLCAPPGRVGDEPLVDGLKAAPRLTIYPWSTLQNDVEDVPVRVSARRVARCSLLLKLQLQDIVFRPQIRSRGQESPPWPPSTRQRQQRRHSRAAAPAAATRGRSSAVAAEGRSTALVTVRKAIVSAAGGGGGGAGRGGAKGSAAQPRWCLCACHCTAGQAHKVQCVAAVDSSAGSPAAPAAAAAASASLSAARAAGGAVLLSAPASAAGANSTPQRGSGMSPASAGSAAAAAIGGGYPDEPLVEVYADPTLPAFTVPAKRDPKVQRTGGEGRHMCTQSNAALSEPSAPANMHEVPHIHTHARACLCSCPGQPAMPS